MPGPPERQSRNGRRSRIVARLALGEGLLAEEVEAVVQRLPVGPGENGRRGRPLAAVEPPALDADRDEVAVLLPPPGAGLGSGEIDEALALVVVGRWPRRRRHPVVAVVEEEAASLRFGEERRVLVDHRIFVGDDAEPCSRKRRDRLGRIGKTVGS